MALASTLAKAAPHGRNYQTIADYEKGLGPARREWIEHMENVHAVQQWAEHHLNELLRQAHERMTGERDQPDVHEGDAMNQLIEATLDDLIHRIETGTADWIKDWIADGLPQNFTTKRRYHGINVLLLSVAGSKGGYPTSKWASYKQWLAAGFQVKGGERSSTIFITKDALKKGGDTDNPRRPLPAAALRLRVQCGAADRAASPPRRGDPRSAGAAVTRCDRLIHDTGALILEGQQPLYRRIDDLIRMPDISQFMSAEGYYATLFHELVHWTGHSKRLDRDMRGAYADEELVAELAAAFICAEMQVPLR